VLGQGGEQLTTFAWAGAASTWQRTNVYGAGKLLATYDMGGPPSGATPTAALHFHLSDPLGTRRMQVGSNGEPGLDCQSLPFGDQQNCFPDPNAQDPTDDSSPLHFTGKERDTESGLDYFGTGGQVAHPSSFRRRGCPILPLLFAEGWVNQVSRPQVLR
jgi:hypothetical protein